MQEMLAEALEAGALGMSSGLFTPPGLYAEPEEIRALGQILKRMAHDIRRTSETSRIQSTKRWLKPST